MEKEPREHSDRHNEPNRRSRAVWRTAYPAWVSDSAGWMSRLEKIGRRGRDGGSVVVAFDLGNAVYVSLATGNSGG